MKRVISVIVSLIITSGLMLTCYFGNESIASVYAVAFALLSIIGILSPLFTVNFGDKSKEDRENLYKSSKSPKPLSVFFVLMSSLNIFGLAYLGMMWIPILYFFGCLMTKITKEMIISEYEKSLSN